MSSASLLLVGVLFKWSKNIVGTNPFFQRIVVLMNQDFPLTLDKKKKSLDCTKLSVCRPTSLAMEAFSAGFAAYEVLFLMPALASPFISWMTLGETAG